MVGNIGFDVARLSLGGESSKHSPNVMFLESLLLPAPNWKGGSWLAADCCTELAEYAFCLLMPGLTRSGRFLL
jgi:hypothetical protein